MSELKPCPFCGGEAEVHPSNDWDAKFIGATFFVWCDRCESRGDYYNTEAEAIEAWNTRAERTCRREVESEACICSECGGSLPQWARCNYCPNCGARVIA